MAHKIAIIKTKDSYSNYGDDRETIITSITDWTEVTHEEYTILDKAQYNGNFWLLEQPVDTKEFVAKTVAEYLEQVKQAEEKAKEQKEKKVAANLARKHKKDLQDRASKLELLKKLQEELAIAQ